MKIHVLHAGYCVAPEHLAIQGGRWRGIHFPAMFALIEHPRFGPMLFDTGYSYRFFDETKTFPNRFYRWLTPVALSEEELAVNQLSTFAIRPRDISHVFISHFHADHVAALPDFACSRYVYMPHAFEAVRKKSGLAALGSAYLSGFIPDDFVSRSATVNMNRPVNLSREYAPFTKGYDLLGDESVIAIELPGHAIGQMGLFVRNDDEQLFFFVADAAWLKQAITENRPPHKIANLLFPDPRAYRETLGDLHEYQLAHSEVHAIPSHCQETMERYCHSQK